MITKNINNSPLTNLRLSLQTPAQRALSADEFEPRPGGRQI
ncbi:MAG: hypothetical protein ACP5IT_03965 [Thermoproteota archaeon]